MSEKSPFLLRERNPDVLTSIANLSNDEVFTPPAFANRMLDTVAKAWADSNEGANIWADKNVRFLDPFTKSGVFLREIVRRLGEGLEKEIPDLQDRINHIVSKQVFGMAITQLTALTTRRSVYCSKRANGKHSIATIFNDEEGSIWFKRTEHTWTGGAQKVITVDEAGNEIEKKLGGKCKHCGASQSEYERDKTLESHAYGLIHTEDPRQLIKEVFGEEMQFDVIIGNPPYQLDDGGAQNSAIPIYQKFVQQAKKLEPRFINMVIPARWYVGGRGLDEFRAEMLADLRISHLHDFPNASEAFPGVEIKGGVCFFLWDSLHQGNCEIVRHQKGSKFDSRRPLLEEGMETFVRNEGLLAVLKKVKSKGPEKSFANIVSANDSFGFDQREQSSYKRVRVPFSLEKSKGTVAFYYNGWKKSGLGYVENQNVRKGHDLIVSHKVLVPRVWGSGNSETDQLKPFYVESPSCCSETYLVIGPFSSEQDAKNAISYLETKFARALISLMKSTQQAMKKVYSHLPLQDFSKPWTDGELYKKYALNDLEISTIEESVSLIGSGDGD